MPGRFLIFTQLVLLGLLSVGCGDDLRSPAVDERIRRRILTPDPPADHYFVADQDCQGRRDPLTLSSSFLTGMGGVGLVASATEFEEMRTALSLQTTGVVETIWGREHWRKCDQNDLYGRRCLDANGDELPWYHRVTDRKLLRVCRDQHAYERESYEAIGLAATHYLGTAHRRIQEARPDLKLAPIKLEVMAKFIDHHLNVEQQGNEVIDHSYIEVDNMAYFPDVQMIGIFPESVGRANQRDQLLHLWESPFVNFHEFGHHVQSMLMRPSTDAVSLTWLPAQHRYGVSEGSPQYTRRQEVFWSSVAEGFADLIALYVARGDRTAFLGLEEELTTGRDPLRNTFSDGRTAKRLTHDAVQSLIGGEVNVESLIFRDPHHVGAVLAFALNRLFVSYFYGDQAGMVPEYNRLLNLAMDWLIHLKVAEKEQQNRAMSANDLFNPLATALERAMSQFPAAGRLDPSSAWRRRICLQAKDLLPALEFAPFADPYSGECPKATDDGEGEV